ncbi:MAG: thiamine pyrophosphate-binding protein [Halobacteria archaeon]
MTYRGSDLFVDALEEYGVEYVFGNPGTTEIPVLDSLEGSDVRYIQALHEDVAVGMAAGYGSAMRYKSFHSDVNPVGVANLHVVPGLMHGLSNLHGAIYAGAPLLVTAGDHGLDFGYQEPILSGDLVKLAEDYTKWSAEVEHIDSLAAMVRRAFKVALTPPTGPVFLGLPFDVMMEETDERPERLGSIPGLGGGSEDDIELAADIIGENEDVVFVVGDMVARNDAVDQVVELAETVGARVYGEIFACEVNFPVDHEQWINFLPPQEEYVNILLQSDVVAFIGCSTNTTLWRTNHPIVDPDVTFVHAGPDPWELGKNRPADVSVIGDTGKIAAGITEKLEDRIGDDELERRLVKVESANEMVEYYLDEKMDDQEFVEGKVEESDSIDVGETDQVKETGDVDSDNDDSGHVCSKTELAQALNQVSDDVFLVDEGVTSRYALLTNFDLERESYLSSKGGGLGYGLPAAVGVAVAVESDPEDDRDVVGFVGDGSYLYYPQAVYAAVRHGLDLTVVVSDNDNYRILKDNAISILGGGEEDHEFLGMDLVPPIEHVDSARSYGATAEKVESSEELVHTLHSAIESGGVDVIDVLVHD